MTDQANSFYKKATETMVYLAGRWRDESQFENIDLYMMPFSKIANECGVQLKAMTKRPFGVKFAVDQKEFHAFIRGNSYEYKRTK